MMKSKIVGVFLSATILLPSLTFAETTSTTSGMNACTRIANFIVKTEVAIADREEKLDAKKTERIATLTKQRADRDGKLEEQRAEGDEKRSERYGNLEARAKTDAEKKALVAFKSSVEAATAVRRLALNKAITIFRTGIDKAITDRKSAVDAMVKTFKTSVNVAFTKAKEDCAAGRESNVVREALEKSLRSAREKFIADRKALERKKDVTELLNVTRKAAVKKAVADFKAAMEKARTDFKVVLGAEAKNTDIDD